MLRGVPGSKGAFEFAIAVRDAQGRQDVRRFHLWVDTTLGATPVDTGTEAVVEPSRKTRLAARPLDEARDISTLQAIVAAMPQGSWKRVNLNNFSDVWTPNDLRPTYAGDTQPPSNILAAWSSFGWDSKRSALFLYGGGHANYRGNDTYIWRASTQRWERASLPSEMTPTSEGTWNPMDGADKAPASAHTYDTTVFLPLLDRMVVLGGAADANGGHYTAPVSPTASRITGPYLFDMQRADGNKVGGTTGSHVKRVSPFPEIVGGNMWQNRESWLHAGTNSSPPSEDLTNSCTGYAAEGGRDVVYLRTRYRLYRYEVAQLANPASDRWQQVGQYYYGGSGGQGTCAFDPARRWLVSTYESATQPFIFWDLSTLDAQTRDVLVAPSDPSGEFYRLLASNDINLPMCALDHDPQRGNFKLWCGDARVWTLTPPSTPTASGWTIAKAATPGGAVPSESVGTGILGKWKYIPNLDVFMGLLDQELGNIWIYKPVNWVSPWGSGNLPPSVSLTSPIEASTHQSGAAVLIAANATDTDGTVSRVEFFANGTKVGEDTTNPYSFAWTPASPGNYALTARATDDRGTSTDTAARNITVSAPVEGGAVTVTVQRGRAGSAADTYLSRYHQASNFGAEASLLDQGQDYPGMYRFAIFASEGGPVPNGAQITSAVLSLYKATPYDMGYAVHRMLVDWGETTATWSQRLPGTAWAAGGAGGSGSDHAALADAVASAGWDPGWVNFNVTASVQQMNSGSASNFGWQLKATGGYTSAIKMFHGSELQGAADLRPKLVVSYTASASAPPSFNQPPTVELASPAPDSIHSLGAQLVVSAGANDTDGRVLLVEFFANGAKIGDSRLGRANILWTPASAGTFLLTARATDDGGATTDSAARSITVLGGGGSATLQRGGAYASADTYLSAYHPTLNFGTEATLLDQQQNYPGLYRFAIFQSEGGPVPNGARITSAVLALYKATAYDMGYAVHRMLVDWTETSATWSQRLPGIPWAAPGAKGAGSDHAAAADASAQVGWDPGWANFDVTAALQQMSNAGANNYGWRLQGINGNGSALKQVYGSEFNGDPSLRPKLTVTWQ